MPTYWPSDPVYSSSKKIDSSNRFWRWNYFAITHSVRAPKFFSEAQRCIDIISGEQKCGRHTQSRNSSKNWYIAHQFFLTISSVGWRKRSLILFGWILLYFNWFPTFHQCFGHVSKSFKQTNKFKKVSWQRINVTCHKFNVTKIN